MGPILQPPPPLQPRVQPPGKWVGVNGLLLLNLGADASAADIEHAPPLGTRAAVEAAIAALLPGTSCDESGRAQFTRSDYAITFELGPGDQVQTATVAVHGQPAIVAIRRLLRKTGWRLFSPQHGTFVEPETLGGLMASAPTGSIPEPLQVRTETRPPAVAWSRTSAAGARYALLAFALLACVAWWVWGSFGATEKDEALVNEEQVIRELIAVGRANHALRVMTGKYSSPARLADPENASRLGIAALPPFFAFEVRHGYRFEMQGDAPALADITSAMLEPAYDSFIYSAVPMNEASTARSFAYISDTSGVYATVKGIPTADDQFVRALQ